MARIHWRLIRSWAWLAIGSVIAITLLITSIRYNPVQAIQNRANTAEAQVTLLRNQAYQGCIRGNVIRREINVNVASAKQLQFIVQELATLTGNSYAAKEANGLQFSLAKVIDCSSAYK